ncbi:hypothetical protein [Streptomyces sp. NPDC058092]|uniref:hypothetical protein n=1 Tax=Streptomyces sp. NPDC058092 TaxID=3346336 RepID=UPI0036EBE2F4
MHADEAQPTPLLLDRFIVDAGDAVPLEAVWAHGSLAPGAPAEVVADVRGRRYDNDPRRASLPWRTRRGHLARTFVRAGIERTLS